MPKRVAEQASSSRSSGAEKLFRSYAIKNKVRRQTLYQLQKQEKSKLHRKSREDRRKERERLGDEVYNNQSSGGAILVA